MEILGMPCYHMAEVFKNGDAEAWLKIGDSRDPEEIKNLLLRNGYMATCDWPSCEFWEEQLIAFPDAKVILTVRDPERWYESFVHTIGYMLADMQHCPFGVRVFLGMGLPVRKFAPMTRKILVDLAFHNDLSKSNIIQCYMDHIEYVKRVCPAEKLLVFDVKEGWEPICKFLDLPIPDEPFPNLNDASAMQSIADKANIAGYLMSLLGLGIPTLFREPVIITEDGKASDKVISKLRTSFLSN
jgi:hypothetical protein